MAQRVAETGSGRFVSMSVYPSQTTNPLSKPMTELHSSNVNSGVASGGTRSRRAAQATEPSRIAAPQYAQEDHRPGPPRQHQMRLVADCHQVFGGEELEGDAEEAGQDQPEDGA